MLSYQGIYLAVLHFGNGQTNQAVFVPKFNQILNTVAMDMNHVNCFGSYGQFGKQ